MQYSYSLKEALDALKPSYQSIDLRAILVAFGDGSGWRNVLTVIRFSDQPVKSIVAYHNAIKDSHELSNEFLNKSLSAEHNIKPFRGLNVELSAYPVNQVDSLLSRLDVGIISCDRRSFRIFNEDEQQKLLERNVSWANYPYVIDDEPWPVFYYGWGQKTTSMNGTTGPDGSTPRIDGHELDRWVRGTGRGFSDFRDLCDYVLEAPFAGGGDQFEIRMPIYAHIEETIVSDKRVKIEGRLHPRLRELSLECSLEELRTQSYSITRKRLIGSNSITLETEKEGVATFSMEFPVNAFPQQGKISAVLFKRQPIRVDLGERSTNLSSGIPSFKSYTSFIPETDIDEYLDDLISGQGVVDCQIFKKFKPKDGSKKVDELLEHITCHLLSLTRLNPVLLSSLEHDVLSGGMSAGSADILAETPDGCSLLVSCTMGLRIDTKANMLQSARTAICQRHGWPQETVKVLLVTGKPSISDSNTSGIRTLAAADLKHMWELIKHGDVSSSLSLMGIQAPSIFR